MRHAESESNAKKVWTGQSDVPLSEDGKSEIELIKKSGKVPCGDFFASSPLRRCTQSLELLYDRAPDLLVDEFKECNLGEWVGMPYENLTTDPLYLSWLNRPDVPPPSGESLNDFRHRVGRGYERLLKEVSGFKSIVLVLHGNVMRAILSHTSDTELPFNSWAIPNSGGYKLELLNDRVINKTQFSLLME